jgi:transcription antitermination factor NusG
LKVRSNCERSCHALLLAQGYDAFLPVYEEKRSWSDRVKTIEVPLFPGYVFCRLDPANRGPLMRTPGIVHIVGRGTEPLSIPEKEIDAVKAVLRSKIDFERWDLDPVGKEVTVLAGPLAGVHGVIVQRNRQCRLVIMITLLQRSVAVEMLSDNVRPRGR